MLVSTPRRGATTSAISSPPGRRGDHIADHIDDLVECRLDGMAP
jgi:hypothetical protein